MSNTWTPEATDKLRELCAAGVPNPEIAAALDMPISKIYAKRSQLGITISKCLDVHPEPEEDAVTHAWQDYPSYREIPDADCRKAITGLEQAIEGMDAAARGTYIGDDNDRWEMQGLSAVALRLRATLIDVVAGRDNDE